MQKNLPISCAMSVSAYNNYRAAEQIVMKPDTGTLTDTCWYSYIQTSVKIGQTLTKTLHVDLKACLLASRV
jgi:hypothetical protein